MYAPTTKFNPLETFPPCFAGAAIAEGQDGKKTKVPIDIESRFLARRTGKTTTNTPGTLPIKTYDYARAMNWLSENKGKVIARPDGTVDTIIGISYFLQPSDGLAFVDFDDCYDAAGNLSQTAKEFDERFGDCSYCEKSQSGRGLHYLIPISNKYKELMAGAMMGKIDGQKIEIYTLKKAVTLTQNIVHEIEKDDWDDIDPEMQGIDLFYDYYSELEFEKKYGQETKIREATANQTPPEELTENQYIQNQLKAIKYISKIPGKAKGGRNNQCYKVACVLINDFRLKFEDAKELLLDWDANKNEPPLYGEYGGETELLNILKSAQNNASGQRGSKIMITTEEAEAKEVEVNVSEIDFRDTDETVDEEESHQDAYGVGGEDMETALRGVEDALNTEFSGKRTILATMVDLMRWRTMYDDEAAPREYCLSTALYAMCACWTNNRFVVHDWDAGSELRNKQAATDPAALEEANPWGKLMITLKTRGGRDRLALQGNFLNIGVSGNGKDQPAKILYDIFPHFGKKLLSTDRLSAEGLIKNAAKNNNNDLHLRITEASEIFDDRAYKHGILTSILTTGYQVGQDSKVNADDRKSAFCGFYWPSMLLSVQPDKIRRRLRKEDLNQGAFRRILYTYAQPAKLTAKEINEINSNIKCGEHYDEMLTKVIKAMKRIGSYVWEVNLGDYPAQIKKRIFADFGKRNPEYLDVESAIYSYTKSVCDMYLPIIAFCMCPQPDLSGDNQMMKDAWNAAEKIMRYYILVAEEVFAMAGNYNEEAEKENEHAKIVLNEIKRLSKEEKYTVKLCVDPENKKYKRFLSYKILRQFSRKIKAILSAEELKKIIMTLEADGKVIWRRPATGGGMGMIAAI